MEIENLINKFNMHPKLIELMVSRGIDDEDKMYKYLYPSIEDLCPIDRYIGVDKVVDRIYKSLNENDTILIYGDYDCDGICSVSMLYLFLKELGANVHTYIPNRHIDGYGINVESIINLNNRLEIDLIITVDCGISSADEIGYIMNTLNIDVIVTDHHIPPVNIPKCLIFNPKTYQENDNVYSDLSGAGVVLRLIEAMSDKNKMLEYIDLACLSTIADIVPLTTDNRIIVFLGLKRLKEKPRKGMDLLAKSTKSRYTQSDIAFKIVPSINACGRLDDANKVLELFLSDDYFLLSSLVREIIKDNNQRKKVTDKIYLEALEMLDSYDLISRNIIMLYKKEWDIGVIGIVAARLAKEFQRPVILMTVIDNTLKGSGRSVKGIDIYSTLARYSDKFISFGGHAQAVGLTINIDNFTSLLDCLSMDLQESVMAVDDLIIHLDRADDYSLFKDMARLEPFGNGNEKPQFKIDNNFSFFPINRTKHIKAIMSENIEIIGFGMSDDMALLNSNIKSSFITDININSHNGYGQYIINDIEFSPINDDRLFTDSRYIKQILYKTDTINYRIIDLKELSNVLTDKYGNLLIASSINTCYNILNIYDNLEFYIENKPLLNPINAIVLAPSTSKISRYYHRLIVLDRPLNDGYIRLFKHKGIREILLLDNDYIIDIDHMDHLKVDGIIKSLQVVSSKFSLKSLDEAYYRVNEIIKCNYLEFCRVFYVLFNLGLIRVIKGVNIIVYKADANNRKEILRRLNEHREL